MPNNHSISGYAHYLQRGDYLTWKDQPWASDPIFAWVWVLGDVLVFGIMLA